MRLTQLTLFALSQPPLEQPFELSSQSHTYSAYFQIFLPSNITKKRRKKNKLISSKTDEMVYKSTQKLDINLQSS